MTRRAAQLTFVRRGERPGLLLWARRERDIPPRLRSSFSRGDWSTDVPIVTSKSAGQLEERSVEGWWLPAGQAVGELATMALDELRRFAQSVAVWVLASKWAVEAIARQQIVPSLEETDVEGEWRARWRVAPVRPDDRSRLSGLASAMPGVARAWITGDGGVLTADYALQLYLDSAVDQLLRAATVETAPLPGVGPDWAVRLARALSGPEDEFAMTGLKDAHLMDGMAQWTAPATTMGFGGRPIIGFRLSEPARAAGKWTLSYHLYSVAGGETISAADLADPDQNKPENMVAPEDTLIEALGRCAQVFEPIRRSLTSRMPPGVEVDASEAWDFLTGASGRLERAGYLVEVPAALSRVGRRRVRARMRIGVEDYSERSSNSSGLLSGLIAFKWEACLGEDTLTAAEFMALAKKKAPLVYHRGQWIAVDPADVARLQALIGQGAEKLEAAEALRLALSGEVALPDTSDVIAEVVCDGAVADALEALRGGIQLEPRELAVPAAISGELRPYQLRGFAWLEAVSSRGFGACLADDMGLGKTIQLITLLAEIQTKKRGSRFLVICPTSVIGNWRRELERFLPGMRTVIHHGASRSHGQSALIKRMDGDDPDAATTVITSYALARRDKELLSTFVFDCVTLDEAQNIKNPDAAQSQAVRHLATKRRVALTGTPVENRLSELWSIIDFLNPGVLGGRNQFKKQFAIPIERYGDDEAAAMLRKVTAPFILRRLKTDPAIAPELPEKLESVRYCPLTREQAALYQVVVDEAMAEISDLDKGMQRRGRILAMLTAIKQICNHPAHYLRDGRYGSRRSGKLTRFLQLLDEVQDTEGHALIFTQYREMGTILQAVIEERHGFEVPFLHGGLSRFQRDDMVAAFQADDGPPAMVISLRAGGTGLNLTRANHVFHYDRWWNPAVEDQATDRAFRIGQTRDVTVHRMVSQGTLEEQIDQILESKRQLADRVVGTGETWLSELDDEMLQSLITLGQDAVLEDDGG